MINIILSGPQGSGKTTAFEPIHTTLKQMGIEHTIIELDSLGGVSIDNPPKTYRKESPPVG